MGKRQPKLCPVCRRAYLSFEVIERVPTYIHRKVAADNQVLIEACQIRKGDVIRGVEMRTGEDVPLKSALPAENSPTSSRLRPHRRLDPD